MLHTPCFDETWVPLQGKPKYLNPYLGDGFKYVFSTPTWVGDPI